MTIGLTVCSCLSWFKQPGSHCKFSWNGVVCVKIHVSFHFGVSYFERNLAPKLWECLVSLTQWACIPGLCCWGSSFPHWHSKDGWMILENFYLQGLVEPSVLAHCTGENVGCSGRGVHFKGRNHQTPRSWTVILEEIFVKQPSFLTVYGSLDKPAREIEFLYPGDFLLL